MKRRDVMKLGAIAGAGVGVGMTTPGCSVPRMLGGLTGADGAAAFNAMLDKQLAGLDKPGMLARLVAAQTKKPLKPEAEAKIAEHDAMFRKMLSTILVTQGFRDLPVETQFEPKVQDRMWEHSDQIATMVFEVSDMLATLDETRRAQIQRTLREQPDLPMTLGAALDTSAARIGLSGKRRMQLRRMMTQSTFRLKHASPSAIIDEYVDKVERLRPRDGRDAAAVELAQRLGERQFWRHHQRLYQGAPPPATGSGSPPPPPATGSGAPPPPPGTDRRARVEQWMATARAAAGRNDCQTVAGAGRAIYELDPGYHARVYLGDPAVTACMRAAPPAAIAPPPRKRRGTGALRAGGYMLGIGAVITIISIPLAEDLGPGVFGITLGVVLMGIALIVLLIGAMIYASSG